MVASWCGRQCQQFQIKTMSKLPYMQFFPTDYLVDTAVLSLNAQGAWMRILCALHASETRGTKTWRLDAWARYIGVTCEVATQILDEISEAGVGNVEEANGNVTLTNRRMLTESITKEQTRLRVESHRNRTRQKEAESACNNGGNASGNANVTPKKSESRSQKSEVIPPNPPASAAEEKQPRPRNELLDCLATVGGGSPLEVPPNRWSAVQRCLREIKAVTPDLTAAEISRRAANYRTHFRDAVVTPEALMKHWPMCENASAAEQFGRREKVAGWNTP